MLFSHGLCHQIAYSLFQSESEFEIQMLAGKRGKHILRGFFKDLASIVTDDDILVIYISQYFY